MKFLPIGDRNPLHTQVGKKKYIKLHKNLQKPLYKRIKWEYYVKKRKEERNMTMYSRLFKPAVGLLSFRSLFLSLALILVSVVILVSVIISRVTA